MLTTIELCWIEFNSNGQTVLYHKLLWVSEAHGTLQLGSEDLAARHCDRSPRLEAIGKVTCCGEICTCNVQYSQDDLRWPKMVVFCPLISVRSESVNTLPAVHPAHPVLSNSKTRRRGIWKTKGNKLSPTVVRCNWAYSRAELRTQRNRGCWP